MRCSTSVRATSSSRTPGEMTCTLSPLRPRISWRIMTLYSKKRCIDRQVDVCYSYLDILGYWHSWVKASLFKGRWRMRLLPLERGDCYWAVVAVGFSCGAENFVVSI